MEKFGVNDAWVYVTERCNLHCEYCFFKHKNGRDVSMEAVRRLFALFERIESLPETLILSGGEPFLARELLFQIIDESRQRFQRIPLHIQTNGLLIDEEIIGQLLDFGVSLEFGIDGALETTQSHRHGLTPESFERLTKNITKCIGAGIKCGSTMTVHPYDVQDMEHGLDFLRQLGIPHVDITPAAFMPWTLELVSLFKKNYLALARRPELRRILYTHEDVKWLNPTDMDLSLHSPDYLFGGDAFLCLTEEKREAFNLWDVNGNIRPEILSVYQKAYDQEQGSLSQIPYREHVCRSFDLINTMMGEEYINTWAINDMLRFLTRVHIKLGI